MGIYGDWAGKYLENGIYTIPCIDKKPIFLEWTSFCSQAPTEQQVESWIEKYRHVNQIGMLLGPATGKVAFDFDYAYDPKKVQISEEEFKLDRNRIEKEVMELLPQTSSGKIGMKGWTRFYKWNNRLVNKSANRNGVRLFDFLSTGRQTIIPPSLHSIVDDKKITYRWIDGDFLESHDLPELSMEVIDTIVSLYSDRPRGQRPALKDLSRHERVMYFIIDALKVDMNPERIATAAIDYDRRVNGNQPYLTDPKYYDDNDAYKNALQFVIKINKWATRNDALKTKEEKKKGKGFTPISWDHFFEIAFPECRKDIFSEETFIRKSKDAKWEQIKSHEGVLRSYASGAGLPKSNVVDELERWTFEKKDMQFLCDIPKWDGVDRIDKIAGSVSSPNFTREQIVEIFKNWGVNVFRRLNDSSVQNRCIILKGDQGFGKDTVVRSMLKDFKPYYETTTLPGTPKDVLEITSRLLVVHIEEFDQTKSLDMGFLKSLITQPTSFFRESYGHSPNQKMMRASFISTANLDDILRDPTGNRRFIVIPVDKIAWEYPQDQSLQVIAQWKELFERGELFTIGSGTEAEIKKVVEAYTPEGTDTLIVDLYRARMRELTASPHGRFAGATGLNGEQVTEMLCSLSKTFSCSLRRVQSAVKSAGLTVRTENGNIYHTDPTAAAERRSRASKKM